MIFENISLILNTFTIKANVPTSHKIPDNILAKKKDVISLKNACFVVVLLSKTNSLFVIYANHTAQNQDNPLLVTSSIPNIFAKRK